MPTVGWVAITVVALVSILNVATANNADNQHISEDPSPVVEEVNLSVEVPDLEPILTPAPEPETNAAVEESTPTLEPEPIPVKVQEPIQTQPEKSNCHSSYSGCLNPSASDYDCAGGSGNGPYYTGPVRVLGPDVYDLDRDSDGMACE